MHEKTLLLNPVNLRGITAQLLPERGLIFEMVVTQNYLQPQFIGVYALKTNLFNHWK